MGPRIACSGILCFRLKAVPISFFVHYHLIRTIPIGISFALPKCSTVEGMSPFFCNHDHVIQQDQERIGGFNPAQNSESLSTSSSSSSHFYGFSQKCRKSDPEISKGSFPPAILPLPAASGYTEQLVPMPSTHRVSDRETHGGPEAALDPPTVHGVRQLGLSFRCFRGIPTKKHIYCWLVVYLPL